MALLSIVLTVTLLATACSRPSSDIGAGSTEDQKTQLSVFAASSLHIVFPKIADDFTAAHPDITVSYNFAGSSTLASQLLAGAPADVFASANVAQMQRVEQAELLATPPEVFITNTLRIVTQTGNPHNIESLEDLANKELTVVICAPQVPCGAASHRALENAGVTLRPDSEENKVTDVLAKVTSGQADAGLVYATDALSAGESVTTVDFANSDKVVNEYVVSPLESAEHPEEATTFADFLTSEAAQQILRDAGFTTRNG